MGRCVSDPVPGFDTHGVGCVALVHGRLFPDPVGSVGTGGVGASCGDGVCGAVYRDRQGAGGGIAGVSFWRDLGADRGDIEDLWVIKIRGYIPVFVHVKEGIQKYYAHMLDNI